MRIVVALILLALLSPIASYPQTVSEKGNAVRNFVLKYAGPLPAGDNSYFSVAFVDLNNDGEDEAIVYFVGSHWCGSGGCNTLVLTRVNTSYRKISTITVSRLPIRVLSTMTNGWKDISVGVSGGGIINGYEARLRFNGKKYPSNPTIAPAKKLENPNGNIVISEKSVMIPLQ